MDSTGSAQAETFPEVDALLRAATPRVWVTPTIAGLLIVCFAASVLLGADPMSPSAERLVELGASFGPLLLEGQWWRAITSSLLHAGIAHLAFNLWAFWQAGDLTERLFGNAAFLAIYVLSAFGADLASVALKPFTVSVGASGAIFGVYGALLAFVLSHRGTLPRGFLHQQRSSLLAFLAYNVVFGLTRREIDLAGHLGGLATGLAAGWILQRDLSQPRVLLPRWRAAIAGLVLLLVVAGWGTRARVSRAPEVRASSLLDRAEAALNASDPATALALSAEALKIGRTWGALAIHGLALTRLSRPEEAVADLRSSLELRDVPITRDAICEAAAESSGDDAARIEAALVDCSRAIETSEDRSTPLGQRAWLRLKQGKFDEALADLATILASAPREGAALQLRAAAYLGRDRLEQAEKDCAILDGPVDGRLLPNATCAEIARRRGDRPLAVKRASLVLERRPGHVGSLLVRAQARFDQGDLDGSTADLNEALRLEPSNAEALNARAWNRVARGEFSGARDDAQWALAGRPHWAPALGTRCFALTGLGHRKTARMDCAESLELDPGNPVDRGMLEFLDDRPAEAVLQWKAAEQAQPEQAVVLEPWIARARGR